ncbi:LacI family DNA-binding transcriptional regulator [Leclercia barmai]|uniref:LacI family DNA-binding transcriptional regulator n=1 Tax=Leclercia barmai TaxID=2785629 RepID=UPI003BB8AC26
MKKNIRIKDIADESGVSIGAVSRALKGQPGLSDETRQRVLSIAKAKGYDFTRLRTNKIKRILFLLHRQHDLSKALPFYSPLILEIENNCRQNGIAMSFLAIQPGDPIQEQLQVHNPDALICAGFFEPELLTLLQQANIPITLVDLWFPGLPSVNPDNYEGGYLATRHLIEQGRKRIAFLASSSAHYSIRQREKGYRKALYEAQILLPPDYELASPPLLDIEQSLIANMHELLALPEPPDAIFAYNDVAAMVSLRVCQQKGFRVPQDIAVVGFDNIDYSLLTTPPLTTISVDKQQLARKTFELVMQESDETTILLPVKLVVRGTTVEGVQDHP